MIERDLDVMKNADYMIDMGPGGGDAGGTIVAAGTPEDIMAVSYTHLDVYKRQVYCFFTPDYLEDFEDDFDDDDFDDDFFDDDDQV